MAFSSVGVKKIAAHVILFIFNIVVLALATKVNKFNDFFYVADLFPLAVSIITLVVLFLMLAADFATAQSPIGSPLIEAGILAILSILWLAFSAFSTSRWRYLPMNCNEISTAYSAERAWCKDVHALKAFMWITFVLCLAITLSTLAYTFMQYRQGNRHIFKTPLAHYSPNGTTSTTAFNATNDYDDPIYGKEKPFGTGVNVGGAYGQGGMNQPDWFTNGNYHNHNGQAEKTKSLENPFERMPPSMVGGGGLGRSGAAKDSAALW